MQIGLDDTGLETLAQSQNALKLSRADLAFCIARGQTGATTVAATMIAAHLAGIAVFATGGIGGVHKGAEHSFDISADLTELSKTPVITVCAGAKAILDLPKTLEVLETLGVPVVTMGQPEFPAFWSRHSGLPSPLFTNDVAEIASGFQTRSALGLEGGMLVANPIPEDAEIPASTLAPLISKAQSEADASGISGKAVTPFLLQRIFELTEGKSLEANIALVRNNARLAAEIAAELPSPPA
jgi:pseudouridine-5'-phosphate glycosidase